MSRDPLNSILVLAVALIVYATLYPFQFEAQPGIVLSWTSVDSRGNFLDVVLNLMFFLPVGLVAGCKWRKRWALLWIFAGAVALSTMVEFAQAYIPGRYSSLRDVFLNGLGAFLGALLAHLPMFDPPVFRAKLSPLLANRGRRILMMLVMAYQYFPFIPVLRVHRLRQIAEGWNQLDLAKFAVIEQAAMGLFVVSMWGAAGGWKVQIFLIALAPFQLFLLNRQPKLDEWLGLVFGYAAGLAWRWTKTEPPAILLAAMASVLMAYKEFQPFVFHDERLNEFTWIPFQATFSIGRAEGFRIICLKSFIYWFTIRQICKATGWRAPIVAALTAVLVMATEFAQQYIPGRTPESTDALICLMGGMLFLDLDRFEDQGL